MKLTQQQFILTALRKGRNGKAKGMALTKSSTLAQAFRMVFGEKADPKRAVKALVNDGDIVARPIKRGGTRLYIAGDEPKNGVEALVAKVLAG